MRTFPLPGLLLSGLLLMLIGCTELPTEDAGTLNLDVADLNAPETLGAFHTGDAPIVLGRFRNQLVQVRTGEGERFDARFRGRFALSEDGTAARVCPTCRLTLSNIGASGDAGGRDEPGLPGVTIYVDLNFNDLSCEAGTPVLTMNARQVQRTRGRTSDPVPALIRISPSDAGRAHGGTADSFFDVFFEVDIPGAPPRTQALVAKGQLHLPQDPCDDAG